MKDLRGSLLRCCRGCKLLVYCSCGENYTAQLEGMYSDIIQSKDQVQDFKTWIESKESHMIPLEDFKVTVLSFANWPYFQQTAAQIPSELSQCIGIYEEFWKQRQVYKKLNWSFMAGTLTLQYNQPECVEITCTSIQGLALLLFNNADVLSFPEICAKVGLSQAQGRRVLSSLMWPAILLEKNDSPDKWKESSKFRLNSAFKGAARITLQAPEEEEGKCKTKVEIDRGITVEAGVVKIMKAKKELCYDELVEELGKLALNFVPDGKMVDESIEKLIADEYIARDPENPKVLKYVAS
eukprot:TRINITY_DN1117_c0_g1_i1.p1 TRINITY_DN1117_c0_g1~~TRINITY_DN1117_c0_g1_i1.p1  ORF type:complete len:296 (+),score=50.84 TRINITY_DN1117_c0_g1_i1:187-1074(+)